MSTFDDKKNPHAAPMGASTEDMKNIILTVYKTSQTYKNLMNKKMGVINITSNPFLFYCTLFKDLNKDGEIPKEWYHHAFSVESPYMLNAEASIEVRVFKIDEMNEKTKMYCRIEKILFNERKAIQAYTRANSAVIESLIHASRIEMYLDTGKKNQANKLIELVDHYDKIVTKVAPDSNYATIMKGIQDKIKKWKIKK